MDTSKIYKVWLDNNANGLAVIDSFIVSEDAVKYAKKYASEHTWVDNQHQCAEDVFASSKIAKVKVYEGDPFKFVGEDDAPIENECLYESGYFYID